MIKNNDKLYIGNISQFSDPNVWFIDREWKKLLLMQESNSCDFQLRSLITNFIEILAQICENIVDEPRNERFRRVNFMKLTKKCNIERFESCALKILSLAGFVLIENGAYLQFIILHSIQPLKYLLIECIYKDFVGLKPIDPQFISKLNAIKLNSDWNEKKKTKNLDLKEEEEYKQFMSEKKEQFLIKNTFYSGSEREKKQKKMIKNERIIENESEMEFKSNDNESIMNGNENSNSPLGANPVQTAAENKNIVDQSTSTKIAQGMHVFFENALLFIVVFSVMYWIIRTIFYSFT